MIHTVSFRKGVQCISSFRSSGIRDFCVNSHVGPQFLSVGSVVGLEIEGVANGCEGGGITAATSADDVLDHHRA